MAPLSTFPDNHYLKPCHPFYNLTHFTHTHRMDESWRMRIGKQPHRRSSETPLEPEDFDDVFGGPPRSVLSRQFSLEDDFARTTMMFDHVFGKSDRKLPEFRIPVKRCEEEFYSDIFGNERRSRTRSNKSVTHSNSKSKSNSSSILSSEEFSPFRPPVGDDGNDDVLFSSFASKLRPINVSCNWSTSEKMHQMEDGQPHSPCNSHSSTKNQDKYETDYIHKFKGCYSGFSQLVSSPEIINFGPNSYTSVKESMEDLQLNSPASIVSSLNHEDEASTILEQEDDEEEEDEDEVMSSYVIEINPCNRERVGETIGVDDAIAWAKQKCQTRTSEKEWKKREAEEHKFTGVEETPGVNKVPQVQESPVLDKRKELITEDLPEQLEQDLSPCKQMELELLYEDVKLWSDGKEPNIRMLLSTLHHILWPSSGWIMIPLANLKESSNVKKAYQKARLCLHPDKLQQRGATTPQKYVAEKAFPILQDAWASFISQDIRSTIT